MLVLVVDEDPIQVSFGSWWWLRIYCLVALEGGIVQERCFSKFGSWSCFDWRYLVEDIETFLSQRIVAEFEWVRGLGCKMLGGLIEGVAPACTCVLVPPAEWRWPCHACPVFEKARGSLYRGITYQLHRRHLHWEAKIEACTDVNHVAVRVMHARNTLLHMSAASEAAISWRPKDH